MKTIINVEMHGCHILAASIIFILFSINLCGMAPPIEVQDFGDAPDPSYPTLLVNNGARHTVVPGLMLGVLIDTEADGLQDYFALGDDQDGTDDEDGVRFLNAFVPGMVTTIEITVIGSGFINAWIDWESNGSWIDAGNQIITDMAVTTGQYQVDILVPAGAATGFTFARFRLSSAGQLRYNGSAPDGEVEDYRILINSPEKHKMHYPQYPDPAGWDVNFTEPAYIGDDWMCSETGPVEDIHFWVSWKNDMVIDNFDVTFTVGIYSDIPAIDNPDGYSKPGKLLWDRGFTSEDYQYSLVIEHPQGWYAPEIPDYHIWDHLNCYRIDMLITEEPFIQQAGTIYWLVIQALVGDGTQSQTEVVVIEPDPADSRIRVNDHPNGGCGYHYDAGNGCLLMYPGMMYFDLSGFSKKITKVEVDIIEWTAPGSTEATLIDNIEIVDKDFSSMMVPQTLVLINGGGAYEPDMLTVSAFEGSVCEIRVYMEGYQIGWKTSLDHFNDEGVWHDPDPAIDWVNLTDPITQRGMDLAFTITGDPIYDYGDAPEEALAYPDNGLFGHFPTCKFLNPPGTFIQHSNFGAFFGPTVDLEGDGNEGLCPVFTNQYNHDECFADGDAGLLLPGAYTITGSPGSEIVVPCKGSPDHPLGSTCSLVQWGTGIDIHVQNLMPNQTAGYVNVLIDWNRDGRWGGNTVCRDGTQVGEHVLVNFLIPNGFNGPISSMVPLPPAFFTGPYAGYVWARFTITEQPVGLPWDGSGVFEDGETEDYLLKLVPPTDLNINNYNIPNGSSDCFDATQTITLGGSSGPVAVQNGGSANFIAGQNIVMLPGTHFHAGSQVHAWIASGGPYCPSPLPKAELIAEAEEPVAEVVTSVEGVRQMEAEPESERFFKVYPNPTPGRFTLELFPVEQQHELMVEVYGILGNRVLREMLPSDVLQHELSLEGQVPGIYIVRLVSGQDVGVERIIKR